MADPVDPVQPDPGQGGETTPESPYQSFLDRIPEQVRDEVEPVFRDWDAQTTRKFQEAAQQRDVWKPYEELGVNQRTPEEVEWALKFLDTAYSPDSNPQAVQDWFQGYAQERGLTPAQAAQQAEEEGYVDPQMAALLEQQLSTHLGPVARKLEEFDQWRQAQEQERAQAQINSTIQSELDALAAKDSGFNKELVDLFIANHMSETDPRVAVQKAAADAERFRNQIEKDTLQGKANTPPGAESGGTAAGTSEPARTLAEAREQARQILRANNQQ